MHHLSSNAGVYNPYTSSFSLLHSPCENPTVKLLKQDELITQKMIHVPGVPKKDGTKILEINIPKH